MAERGSWEITARRTDALLVFAVFVGFGTFMPIWGLIYEMVNSLLEQRAANPELYTTGGQLCTKTEAEAPSLLKQQVLICSDLKACDKFASSSSQSTFTLDRHQKQIRIHCLAQGHFNMPGSNQWPCDSWMTRSAATTGPDGIWHHDISLVSFFVVSLSIWTS